jgi:hypothetical protein
LKKEGRSEAMKRVLVLVLVLGLASAANAAVTLVDGPVDPINIGETATIVVNNSEDGAYSGWLEIAAPTVADFDGMPELTAAGNPDGNSSVVFYPEFGAWYEFSVISFSPTSPVLAGDHVVAKVIGVGAGTTALNLYAGDGETLLDSFAITVIPEPMTIALLGLGGLLLHRRK